MLTAPQVLGSLLAAAVPQEVLEVYEEQSVQLTAGEYQNEKFRYRLMKPAGVKTGQKYPLVLFLHGAGERGDDNQSQLQYLPTLLAKPEYREKYPCFVLAPQCRTGKRWVEVPWEERTSRPMTDVGPQMQAVLLMLDQVTRENPVDLRRIYLTGLSMGGYGTWDLAARMPERFAAAAPICGGGDERQAARLKDLPLWAWHGDADTAVPVERSRTMIEAIKAAGGQPKYTELPGVGHNSWTPAYTDPQGVVPWLFAQARKS